MTEELRKRLEWVKQEKERLMKWSKKRLVEAVMFSEALWQVVENYDVCENDYQVIDRYHFPIDKYAETAEGEIIRVEMYNILEEEHGLIYSCELKEEYE